jgi:hypothetical protein
METGGFTHCTLMYPILVVSNRIATLGAARDTFLNISGSEGTASIQEQEMGQHCL